jgi:predicted nucleotidyltransferase
MARRKNIKLIVKRFVKILSREIRIQKVILFGSYASGHPHRDSDVDIAVVSPDLGKQNEMEEMAHLLKKAHEVDIDLEPHPFHPRELRHPEKCSFAYEILKTGKIVYST